MTLYAGEVLRRRNRRTKTPVVLIDRHNGGDWIDGDYRWALLCDEHSTLLDCHTFRHAKDMLAAPDQWCENCREKIEGPGPSWLHTYVP